MRLPSSIQFSGGPIGAIWCRWSITEIELKPESSAATAMSDTSSNSRSAGVSGWLKFVMWRSSVIGARTTRA